MGHASVEGERLSVIYWDRALYKRFFTNRVFVNKKTMLQFWSDSIFGMQKNKRVAVASLVRESRYIEKQKMGDVYAPIFAV